MTPTPADLRAARLDLELSPSIGAVDDALEAARRDYDRACSRSEEHLALVSAAHLGALREKLAAEVERLIPVEAARIAARREEEALEEAA